MKEYAVTINRPQSALLSIIHEAAMPMNTGVLIVVGGPQYRVGSHRQFVQLSRYLASSGVSSMRFDYMGMGDSEGEKKPFDNICDDINAAIDIFFKSQPALDKVVIWGLCDAATAAAIYAYKDKRVAGLVLLNPWLRSEQAMGKAMVKFYYLQRLLSLSFWQKLFTGKLNIAKSAIDAKGFIQDSVSQQEDSAYSYQHRMRSGIEKFNGKVCLILSGNDLTAREFDEQTSKNKRWGRLRAKGNQCHRLTQADHTFSSSEFKQQVEKITLQFVQTM